MNSNHVQDVQVEGGGVEAEADKNRRNRRETSLSIFPRKFESEKVRTRLDVCTDTLQRTSDALRHYTYNKPQTNCDAGTHHMM